jgi:hypothetical protein
MTSDTTSFTSLQTDDHTGWPGADGRDITFFTATNALRYNRWQLLNHLDALTRSIDTALGGLGAGFSAVVTWYWDQHTNFTDPAILRGVDRVSDPDVPSTGPERHYALDTFERIRDLLGLDDQRMAALVRISRNTPRDWRHGNRPKGATTRRLYELASVIDVVAAQEPDLPASSATTATRCSPLGLRSALNSATRRTRLPPAQLLWPASLSGSREDAASPGDPCPDPIGPRPLAARPSRAPPRIPAGTRRHRHPLLLSW